MEGDYGEVRPPPRCKYCGERIEFMKNWRGKPIVLDPYPPEWRKESYVEVEMEVFVSVFRHVCMKKPTIDS